MNNIQFSGVRHYRGASPSIEQKVNGKINIFERTGVPVVGGHIGKDRYLLLDGDDAAKFAAEAYGVETPADLKQIDQDHQKNPDRLSKKLDDYYMLTKILGDTKGEPVKEFKA